MKHAQHFPPAILTHHIAILGKTGSGKTNSGKVAVEQVVLENDARVCILDPIKSDWWGLTLKADGKRAGLPFYILGGPRGHVPLHAGAGKAIGEIVASGALRHSIIDMADFGPGEHANFFVDFSQALFRNIRGVLYLVIEEAHIFAPKERIGQGAETISIHWTKRLATAARSKGLRLIVSTQRTQDLNNAVLGSCETMIAHRITLPADKKPIVAWLRSNTDKKAADTIEASLSSLKTGEGWICSGELGLIERRTFPKSQTYDNTATPDDDAAANQIKTPAVDQTKLRALIGEAIAEADANDPKKLREQIAELKAELVKQARAKSAPPVVAKPDDATIKQAAAAAVANYERQIRPAITERDMLIETLTGQLAKIGELAKTNGRLKPRALPAAAAAVPVPSRSTAPAPPRPADPVDDEPDVGGSLPPGERKVLIAAAQNPGCDRSAITILTGFKKSSANQYISRLRGKGFLDSAQIAPTPQGIAALGSNYKPLPTGAALREYWLAKLPDGEKAVLEPILAAHPSAINTPDIWELAGYKKSSTNQYISRLMRRRLVVKAGKSSVKASDDLF